MTQATIRVGTIGYPAPKKKLFAAANVIEDTAGDGIPPKPATGRRWRKEAPARVEFCVQASRYLSEAPASGTLLEGDVSRYGGFALTDENQRLWQHTLAFAQALAATHLVLLTPASFTPAKRNIDAFRAFLGGVDRCGKTVVWEPRGPWEVRTAARVAAELGLLLAVDPLRDEPPAGPEAYFRLGPFSVLGARVGVYDLERLADVASRFERVTVVFGTNKALDDARNLQGVLLGGARIEDVQDEE